MGKASQFLSTFLFQTIHTHTHESGVLCLQPTQTTRDAQSFAQRLVGLNFSASAKEIRGTHICGTNCT